MLTEKDILTILDTYAPLITLNEPYSYLIDCRLNIFRSDNEKWAIVAERLGYNSRGDAILLELSGVGNCLNGRYTIENTEMPIDWDSFNDTLEYEALKPDARYWKVRDNNVELSHKKQDYIDAGIELKELEPDEISAEEVCRLFVTRHRDLFRATDEELYQLIPNDLNKILVIDEWYHKDYKTLYEQHISEEKINITYKVNKHLAGGKDFMDYDTFVARYKQDQQRIYNESLREWQDSLPSSYETWQQIAKVIASGDTTLYKPILAPNTHWKNWPESGAM